MESSLRVAVIGGTGGLGQALSRYYAGKGALVTVFGRTFRDQNVSNIDFVKADLSLMSTINELVTKKSFDINKYELIIFTAGIFAATKRQETSEGLELDLASSYINRLLLLEKTLPELKETSTKKPRIVIMAYPGNNQLGTIDDLNQEKGYGVMSAHMNTVAGNEALVTHYADKSAPYNIYGLNPGIVKTNIRDNLLGKGWISSTLEFFVGLFNKTPEQYADVIGPLLVDPKLEGKTGTFYNSKGKEIPGSKGLDKNYADKFVSKSKELLTGKGLY